MVADGYEVEVKNILSSNLSNQLKKLMTPRAVGEVVDDIDAPNGQLLTDIITMMSDASVKRQVWFSKDCGKTAEGVASDSVKLFSAQRKVIAKRYFKVDLDSIDTLPVDKNRFNTNFNRLLEVIETDFVKVVEI